MQGWKEALGCSFLLSKGCSASGRKDVLMVNAESSSLAKVVLEEGTLRLSHRQPRGSSLDDNLCMRAQLIVGSATPGQASGAVYKCKLSEQ